MERKIKTTVEHGAVHKRVDVPDSWPAGATVTGTGLATASTRSAPPSGGCAAGASTATTSAPGGGHGE